MAANPVDPKLIDGKKISESVIDQVKQETEQLKKDKGITPGLAVVLVVSSFVTLRERNNAFTQGARPDSATYVRQKKLAAEKAGFNFLLKEVPATVKQGVSLYMAGACEST